MFCFVCERYLVLFASDIQFYLQAMFKAQNEKNSEQRIKY